MSEVECSNTAECNIDGGVAKLCFTDGICRCSALYGFAGEDCTETTPKLIILRVFNVLSIIIATVLLAGHIYLVGKIFMSKSKANVTYRIWAIILLSFTSTVTSLTASSLRSISYYDSSTHELLQFNELGIDTEVVVAETDYFAFKLWTTDFCLGILMSNMIVLSWFSIIKKVSEVFPDVLAQREKNLATFLKFYIPLFVVLLVINLIIVDARLVLTLALLSVNNILFLLLFVWLTIYVVRPIKEQVSGLTTPKTSGMKRAIELITFTLKLIIVLGIFNIIATSLGVFGLQIYPSNPSEGLGTIAAIIERFVVLTGLLYSTFGLWYTYRMSSHSISKKRRRSSV